MMKSQTLRTLLAGALFALSPLASATLIASDDFNYDLGTPLNSKNGGAGWGSAWTAVTGVTVVDPATDLSGDRAAQFTTNSNNAAYRKLGSTFSGDNLYVGFLVQIAAGSLTLNDFLGLWLDNVTTGDHTNRPNIGIKADEGDTSASPPNPTNDVFVRTNGTGGNFVPGSNLTNGTTYHIVGHLSRTVPGNYTKFDAWLDPLVGQASTPEASFTGNAGINSINYVGFRTANLDAGDSVLVDQLRIADSWNSVMGIEPAKIPEPAGLALMGLGLVALGLSRRRRM